MIPTTTHSQRWHLPSFSATVNNFSQTSSSMSMFFFSRLDQNLLPHLRTLAIKSYLPILSYLEKILLIIDFFQVFGIIWCAAQPWPWPYIWIHYTKPLVYANLDYFSTTDNGALAGRSSTIAFSQWGELKGQYTVYSIIFAVIALLISLGLALCYFAESLDDYLPSLGYGQITWLHRYKSHGLLTFMILAYCLYLPCSLAVFRLYYCEDGHVAADPTIVCLGLTHTTLLAIETLFIFPLFILFPLIVYRCISKNMIYQNALDHEKKIQIWEISYMLQLDNYWLDEQIWLFSSYQLSSAFMKFHILILKGLLLMIFIFIRSNLMRQAGLMTFLLIVFTVYYIVFCGLCGIRLPYRNWTSNIILLIVVSLWIIDVVFGLANSANVRNAVMVASSQSLFLGSCNFLGWVAMAGVFLYMTLVPHYYVLDWPTLRTISRIYHNEDLLPRIAHWVETIRESQEIQQNFLLSPLEIADIKTLEESIRQLRSCWLSARTHGSIFESIISDHLEQLLLIHAHALPYALRKFDYWDEAYREASQSKTKVSGVATEMNAFSLRSRQYAAMNPNKRRILMKLLAFKFIQGKYYERGEFSIEIALKQKKENQRQLALKKRLQRQQEREKIRQRMKEMSSGFSWERFRFGMMMQLGYRSEEMDLLRDGEKEGDGDDGEDEMDHGEVTGSGKFGKKKKSLNDLDMNDENAIEGIDYVLDADGNRVYTEEYLAAKKEEEEEDMMTSNTNNNSKKKDGEDTGLNLDKISPRPSSALSSSRMKRFNEEMVEEARKMIARLQQRTELALNKHSKATKQILEQQKQQLLTQAKNAIVSSTSAGGFNITTAAGSAENGGLSNAMDSPSVIASSTGLSLSASTINLLTSKLAGASASTQNLSLMNASSNTLNKLGLSKIATMDLIKETVDEEEQKDLEDLFHLWDEAIHLYEQEQFPGDYEKLNNEVENWYAYRGLVSQRLEIVMKMLDDQLAFLDDIGAQEVIEEDDDEDLVDDVDVDSDEDADEETGLLKKKGSMDKKDIKKKDSTGALDGNNMLGKVGNSSKSMVLGNEVLDEENPPPDRFSDWY